TSGQEAMRRTLRITMGAPFSSRNCLGVSAPMRVPMPAAGKMAAIRLILGALRLRAPEADAQEIEFTSSGGMGRMREGVVTSPSSQAEAPEQRLLWHGLGAFSVRAGHRLVGLTVPKILLLSPFDVLTAEGLVLFRVRCFRKFKRKTLAI